MVASFLVLDINRMKRGNQTGNDSKKVNSEKPITEDTTNLVFEDPFIDQYEEEEIVDGNEENEDMAEEDSRMSNRKEKDTMFVVEIGRHFIGI